MDNRELIRAALTVRENAYAPYSHFMVGAALLGENGRIYTGCNMENSAFAATLCAEQAAFSNAIVDGTRHFQALAIVGGKEGEGGKEDKFVFPCGICRQVMLEFCKDDLQVIVANNEKDYKIFTLAQLLPQGFHYPPPL